MKINIHYYDFFLKLQMKTMLVSKLFKRIFINFIVVKMKKKIKIWLSLFPNLFRKKKTKMGNKKWSKTKRIIKIEGKHQNYWTKFLDKIEDRKRKKREQMVITDSLFLSSFFVIFSIIIFSIFLRFFIFIIIYYYYDYEKKTHIFHLF